MSAQIPQRLINQKKIRQSSAPDHCGHPAVDASRPVVSILTVFVGQSQSDLPARLAMLAANGSTIVVDLADWDLIQVQSGKLRSAKSHVKRFSHNHTAVFL
jgi:hypothetical protein